MAWDGFYVTNRGKNLIAKVVASQTNIPFTNFKVGDGTITSQSPANMMAMINPLYTFPVSRLIQKSNIATIGFQFDNQQVTSGFYWREIGLYATDPDLGEILFAYTNSGQGAEYVDAGGSNNVLTQLFDFNLTISDTINVTAQLDQTIVYASKQELNDAFEDAKEYTDERFDSIVIPNASTTQKGIVQLTNNFDGTSEVLAPTQKALNTHVIDTVAHMTKAQKDALANAFPKTGGTISGNVTVTGHIEAPLLQGDISAVFGSKNANLLRWVAHISGNNLGEGTLYLSPSGSPSDVDWKFDKGININYSSGKLANNGRVLLDEIDAIKTSGVDRKNQLVSAINANGGSASTSEDMSVLIQKLNAIANTRFKEGRTTGGGFGNNIPPEPIVTPSGYYKKQIFGNILSVGTNSLFSRYIDRDGGSVTVTAKDKNGRTAVVFSYSQSNSTIGFKMFIAQNGSVQINDTITTIDGFDISGGVTFSFSTTGGGSWSYNVSGQYPVVGG